MFCLGDGRFGCGEVMRWGEGTEGRGGGCSYSWRSCVAAEGNIVFVRGRGSVVENWYADLEED